MTPIRQQLLAPAVYAYLCHGGGLGNLPTTLADAICKSWGVDSELLDRLGIVRYPTSIENFMAAEECARQFGDLEGVDGFYQLRGLWRLDLDDRFFETGFLMPVTHPKHGWISHLVAFRNPRDRHPFPLKTRRETRAAA